MTDLQILVSTVGQAGLQRCTLNIWPHIDNVRYLVSCQYEGDIPKVPDALTSRGDVDVVFTPTHGLSANRNNALDNATASLVLIADDDTDFHAGAIADLIATFRTDPALDIVAMRFEGPKHKAYPPDGHNLAKRYRGYYFSSVELAFRLKSIESKGLRFSLLAGIGASPLTQGEEELFMLNALECGLRGIHRDIVIARHPAETTGTRFLTPGALMAKGAVIRRRRPILGWAAILVEARRLRHTPAHHGHGALGFTNALRHLLAGALYGLRHRSRL